MKKVHGSWFPSPAPRAGSADGLMAVIERCRDRRVLDIGDLHPRLHERIAEVALDVVAMDVDYEGIERLRAAGYNAFCGSISQRAWSASDTSFDVVVADGVIEHLTVPSALLDFARDRLQPGGVLVLTTSARIGAGSRALADRSGLILRTAVPMAAGHTAVYVLQKVA